MKVKKILRWHLCNDYFIQWIKYHLTIGYFGVNGENSKQFQMEGHNK